MGLVSRSSREVYCQIFDVWGEKSRAGEHISERTGSIDVLRIQLWDYGQLQPRSRLTRDLRSPVCKLVRAHLPGWELKEQGELL
jgi:hypothetical protein